MVSDTEGPSLTIVNEEAVIRHLCNTKQGNFRETPSLQCCFRDISFLKRYECFKFSWFKLVLQVILCGRVGGNGVADMMNLNNI